jgi:hypothetical protein
LSTVNWVYPACGCTPPTTKRLRKNLRFILADPIVLTYDETYLKTVLFSTYAGDIA